MSIPRTFSLFSILLALSVSLHAQDGIYAPTKIAQMDAAAYLQPLPANNVIPLQTIASDFASNAVAAVGKYGGQRITVIGRISAISKSESENKVMSVTLQGAGASLPAVKAEFLAGSIPVNSEIQMSADGSSATLVTRDPSGVILSQNPFLSVDQRVGIKGDFKEQKVGDIILTDCALVPKEKLRELGIK